MSNRRIEAIILAIAIVIHGFFIYKGLDEGLMHIANAIGF